MNAVGRQPLHGSAAYFSREIPTDYRSFRGSAQTGSEFPAEWGRGTPAAV